MTKRIIAIVVIVLAAAGVFYWQYKKRQIVKSVVQDKIRFKTDSLYRIQYDSSYIDEVNGDAAFYNVRFGVDSSELFKKYVKDDVPYVIFKVAVDTIEAKGVDAVGLGNNTRFKADTVRLVKPLVRIFQVDTATRKELTAGDTAELYRRMLGQFDEINAKYIQVVDGVLLLRNLKDSGFTLITGINLSVHDFMVDSVHKYDQIFSYFVASTTASCERVIIRTADQRTEIRNLVYDAAGKYLTAASIIRDNLKARAWRIDDVNIRNLNTQDFVYNHAISASSIDIGKCDASIKLRKPADREEKRKLSLLLPTAIYEINVDQLDIGPSNINIELASKKEISVPGLEISLSKVNINSDIADIVSWLLDQRWKMKTGGEIVLPTNNKWYRFLAGPITYDHERKDMTVQYFKVLPRYSEEKFRQLRPIQKDYYNLQFNNLSLTNIQLDKLVTNTTVIVDSVRTKAVVRIATDRTLKVDSVDKIGNYPQHVLEKVDVPIEIKKLIATDWTISYKEKSAITSLPGFVTFQNINGTLTNITNMPEALKRNAMLKVNARALLLGRSVIETEWSLPQGPGNNPFSVTGKLFETDATTLNDLAEPMASTSFKSGKVNSLVFRLNGNDTNAAGKITFLYEDLKLQMFKTDSTGVMDKKGLKTLFANFLIRNNNPSGEKLKVADVTYKQDPYRSFFNLAWKTIFAGIKETASKL